MKRIICVMLTLIMLVSLVPATAITADAATLSTSRAAVTVLKNMLSFQRKCYNIEGTNEYRIGYGTICTKSHAKVNGEVPVHTMTQTVADTLMGEAMEKMDKEVNNFASNNSLDLDQGEFDALALFSYLTGTAWMSGNGNVKTAVKNDAESTQLLNAFNAVLNNSTRSKILVNMYFNEIYSNDVSDNYSYVIYNANGGDMPVENNGFKLGRAADGSKTYTMQFDASESTDHPVTPTKNGSKFMGWYFEDVDGETKISAELDESCKGETLVAFWQLNGMTPKDASNGGAVEVHYDLEKSSVASKKLYNTPDTDDKFMANGEHERVKDVSSFTADEVHIYREYVAENGSRWGMTNIKKNPWIKLSDAPSDSSDDSDSSSSGGGGHRIGVNVTNAYVNIRDEANIYSAKVGTLTQGDRVYVSRTENSNGFVWGHAYPSRDSDDDLGWIAVMYTDYNTAKYEDQGGSSDSDDEDELSYEVIAKATVTYNGYLNMRDNAGTANKIVGSLAKNEIVNIYEIKTVNGSQWGRTNGGWICLSYTSVEMLEGDSDISNEGSEAYTFTAKANPVGAERLSVYVDATSESNLVDSENAPKSGDDVSVITTRIRNNKLWVKIGWTYENAKGKDVTKYGWVLADGNAENGLYIQAGGDNINLNATKFTVVSDSLNARKKADTGSGVVTKLNKGYEFQVTKVTLTGEDMWGCTTVKNSDNVEAEAWVNLASKYAQRSDLVDEDSDDEEEDDDDHSRDFATIVGADLVNVRADHKISSKQVGQLRRGTVVEILDWEDGWFQVDADVDNDDDTESWVYGDYVEESEQSDEIANAPSSHGTGVVANTYGGLNVRTGPSTAHAIVGTKLLPGTQVQIKETTYTGITKWGRIGDNKWVCMDYISMTNEVFDEVEEEKPEAPNGGEWVKDYDEIDRTTTTAVYTGTANGTVRVWANTQHHDETDTSHVVRTLNDGDPLTIYELIAVEERVEITPDTDVDSEEGSDDDEDPVDPEDVGDRYEIITHYWARTNDGYVINPQNNIKLNALEEKAHTLTGSDTLNVRPEKDGSGEPLGKLNKGDVVKVTALNIVKDKVWGRIEYTEDDVYVEDGWIRLDYMSEGAYYKDEEKEEDEDEDESDNTPAPPSNNNSTGDIGKSDGTYRYDGKIKSEVRMRSQANTGDPTNVVRTLKAGEKIYIYDTTLSGGMAWGRTDGGYVSLHYVDMTPRDSANGIDARVVYRVTDIYSDANRSEKVGSYAAQAVVDIYEVVGNMARTELGWVNTGDLL